MSVRKPCRNQGCKTSPRCEKQISHQPKGAVFRAESKEVARPARFELAAPRLGVRRIEAARDSAKPLPLILLGFCHTPNHPRPP